MLVIGVSGHELTARERDWLQHDACGGVILFKRNFVSKTQVAELSAAIRAASPRPQLICVDQEGGRVQRFDEGYSALPPLEGFDRQKPSQGVFDSIDAHVLGADLQDGVGQDRGQNFVSATLELGQARAKAGLVLGRHAKHATNSFLDVARVLLLDFGARLEQFEHGRARFGV